MGCSTVASTPPRRPCWQRAVHEDHRNGLARRLSRGQQQNGALASRITNGSTYGDGRRRRATGRLMLVPKAGDDYWHEVTFTRAEVLAEFPVRTEQAQSQIPPSGVVREAISPAVLKQKAEEAPPVSPEPATPNDKPASAPATEPPPTAAEVPARTPGATTKAGKPRKKKSSAQTIAAVKEIIALAPEGRDPGSRSVRTSRD